LVFPKLLKNREKSVHLSIEKHWRRQDQWLEGEKELSGKFAFTASMN